MPNWFNININRRSFFTTLGGFALLTMSGGCGLRNPCRQGLPATLTEHPLTTAAWQGIDTHKVWDCHVHIAGNGDSGSGITLTPEMESPWHPWLQLQRLFYLNAGCVDDRPGHVDQSYLHRLRERHATLPAGVKLMLLAFDHAHSETGKPLPNRSAFFVPNTHARDLAKNFPNAFEWIASIHPYRPDAVDALQKAHSEGARAVKWLPPAMGIDPAHERCLPFYRAMTQLDMPLLTHAGEEKAVRGMGLTAFGNPLRLRKALETGVRVIVAHCASLGEEEDSDHGNQRVAGFDLFTRMMDHPDHRDRLFGDISAITLRNRDPRVVRTLLERNDWHDRLLNGSDYPLPGILPLISPQRFARAGLLNPEILPVLEELQTWHPLLFDFVLKRHLAVGGRRFAAGIFETRPFFLRSLT
ncbi:MAG: amidohydrolase [Magnetococcales bacterium]|nr:amidohydrolase [Magnetococcales bacterium]